MNPRALLVIGAFALLVATAGCRRADPGADPAPPDGTVAAAYVHAPTSIDAGRYLVIAGACNDCHTPGYETLGNDVPEEDWLIGSPIGFRGPWGTSYPANLRLVVQDMTEDEFVHMLRTRNTLPPMPWPNVNRLHEQDVRSIYRFIRSLGPAGVRRPAPVAPGVEPETPYFVFEPQHMERLGAPAAVTPVSAQ